MKTELEVTELESRALCAIAARCAVAACIGRMSRDEPWLTASGVAKPAAALTDDEIGYVTERLHWLAVAALNHISLLTGTKFPVVLGHFTEELKESVARET